MNTMADTDWITDRPPTEADADADGEVLTPLLRPGPWSAFTKWDQVPAGLPWRHTSWWRAASAPAPAPATTPRLFTSITYADDRYIALADDGTAWFNFGKGWLQLEPLPAREVGQ